MKNRLFKIPILVLLFSILLIPIAVNGAPNRNGQSLNNAVCNLKTLQRKLWSEHVQWTRSYIVSDLSNLGDKNAVLQRLLKNQDDIGNSIQPYYGEEAANQLAKLLREHIMIGGQVINAAKTGNKSDLKKFNEEWYKNADEIASFLSKANPHWSEKDLKDMLHGHLQYVTDQVVSRLNQDWDAEIKAYDQGYEHMLHLADIITEGIVAQFPKKFQ